MVDTAAGSVVSSVTAATTTTQLVAANSARKGLFVVNDSTANMYLSLDANASTTHYTAFLQGSAGGIPTYWELPWGVVYTGVVSAVWASATGSARCTEL